MNILSLYERGPKAKNSAAFVRDYSKKYLDLIISSRAKKRISNPKLNLSRISITFLPLTYCKTYCLNFNHRLLFGNVDQRNKSSNIVKGLVFYFHSLSRKAKMASSFADQLLHNFRASKSAHQRFWTTYKFCWWLNFEVLNLFDKIDQAVSLVPVGLSVCLSVFHFAKDVAESAAAAVDVAQLFFVVPTRSYIRSIGDNSSPTAQQLTRPFSFFFFSFLSRFLCRTFFLLLQPVPFSFSTFFCALASPRSAAKNSFL